MRPNHDGIELNEIVQLISAIRSMPDAQQFLSVLQMDASNCWRHHFALPLAAGNLLTSHIYLSYISDYAEGITSKIKIPPPGLEPGSLG